MTFSSLLIRALRVNLLLTLLLIFGLFLTLTQARAQQFATLRLSVADPQGSAVAQAKIAIRNVDTGVVRNEVSDSRGAASVPGLSAGQYAVTVDADSFAPYQAPLVLTLGQVADLQISLRIRTNTEQVEVHDTAQGVEKERIEASQVIDPKQISDLPISDRDFIDFVLLTPTATVRRNSSTGAQSAFQETVLEVSLGGLRETHSVFYGLDGVDYTTVVSGVQRVSPSLDWVQEFRVVDGPDAAGSGLSLGAAVDTITKSGTNDLHGSVYEYIRNNASNANNLLSAPGFNTLRFNQFGATVGGPLRKDKAFFFLDYEGQRHAHSPIYSRFILKCIDTAGCLGPGTPSINQIKTKFGQAADQVAFWHKLVGLYVQDQWKVRQNLVLSAGIRYDVDVLPSASDLKIVGQMNPTNFGNVQPRVGLAYGFRNGKGAVRSRFGLYTGSLEYSSLVNGWHGASIR